jgi:hypothetical protein
MRFVPARHAPIAFGVIISGMMSFLVTLIATAKVLGLGPGFVAAWMSAWSLAWPIAAGALLLLRPVVQRIVAAITLPAGRS